MLASLITKDAATLAGANALRSIYDPTAGSGGMLLVAQDALRGMNEKIDITLYGQELMPAAFGLGKADLLIQGGRPEAIKQRSEEHTSELQSLMRISSAVFCLKKKTHHIYRISTT